MKFYLIFILILTTFIGCRKNIFSTDNGNFVGEWYVLNFEVGKEHWKIDSFNNVLFYNKYEELTGKYHIDKLNFESGTRRVLISEDRKDTIWIDGIETPSDFPTKISPDTIRFYHSFVMVRNNNPPKTELSKKKIIEHLENSFWEYDFDNTKVEFFLTDSLLNNDEKLAYLKMSGCYEYSSPNQRWSLDTLTNNLVLNFTIEHGRWQEQMLIKKITEDKLIVDRDDFYWFNKNLTIKKKEPWNLKNFHPSEDFKRIYSTPACSY